MIWQKINYIHANPVKAGLVSSAKDYYWSGFRSFYSQSDEPLAVDHNWWWPEDSEKLSQAMKEMGWYSFEKGDEELASMNYGNDQRLVFQVEAGTGSAFLT